VEPPFKVVLTPVEAQTFDVVVSAPNPLIQVVSEGPQGPTGPTGAVGPPGEQGEPGQPGAAATVDVGTVTTVGPTVAPDVQNSGSTSVAVLDFDLPRAAAVSVGATSTVGPSDPAAVTDSGSDGDVVLDFAIPQGVQGDQGDAGPKGDPGIVISPTEPDSTDVLWADTSEEGDAVLPVGGTTGQSLVKASDADYDSEWADIDGLLPQGGATGEVLVKQSATDYDTAWVPRGWTVLDQQVLAADSLSVTVNPSFAGYSFVRVTIYYRLNRVSVSARALWLRLNAVDAADYDWVRISRTGTTSGGANANADTKIILGNVAGNLQDTDISGVVNLTINVSGGYRSVVWTHVGSSTAGTVPEVTTGSGYLKSTSSLTSLGFSSSDGTTFIRAGSTFIVEGI
jgi:hypothetical protein